MPDLGKRDIRVALRKESVDRNGSGEVFASKPRRSLSARRAWIEIRQMADSTAYTPLSLSARRAWIEIRVRRNWPSFGPVALRKESVDRNSSGLPVFLLRGWSLSARRAWIEMSPNTDIIILDESLSARRAWIEIETMLPSWTRYASLSARRAWIEIKVRYPWTPLSSVALRKESVDRNQYLSGVMDFGSGRSPQGERG